MTSVEHCIEIIKILEINDLIDAFKLITCFRSPLLPPISPAVGHNLSGKNRERKISQSELYVLYRSIPFSLFDFGTA